MYQFYRIASSLSRIYAQPDAILAVFKQFVVIRYGIFVSLIENSQVSLHRGDRLTVVVCQDPKRSAFQSVDRTTREFVAAHTTQVR